MATTKGNDPDNSMIFTTDFTYGSREEKSEYVWKKYGAILRGHSILDVGGDECHLKQHLDTSAQYWGVGMGGHPDQELDLDRDPLPFADEAYDTVLCLDVLEHLENLHRVFDDICRVTRRYVIISLPNCLGHLWRIMTRFGPENPNASLMKFYGLPLDPPPDRHRWFFDGAEAEQFIRGRASRNGMQVVQLDWQRATTRPMLRHRIFRALALKMLLRKDISMERLDRGTVWAVLEKHRAGE